MGYLYSFELVFWVSSDKFPEVELLDHKAVPFQIFWGISILLCTLAAPFCIPTDSAKWFLFLHIFVSICCLLIYGDKSIIAVGDLWQPYVTDTKVSGEEFVENCMLERLGWHYVNLMTSLRSTQSGAARIMSLVMQYDRKNTTSLSKYSCPKKIHLHLTTNSQETQELEELKWYKETMSQIQNAWLFIG